jgi:DEAD/DEAH box helicase domain-containing protein
VLCGYPGSIASTWQQIGRAGRTTETALALLVATAGVLDQYILQQVDYLFAQSPEHALVNPENSILLVDHVRCAAAELPFRHGEQFGPGTYLDDALTLLAEMGEIYRQGGHCFWGKATLPAA